ncbi:MAG: hypothetical protein V4714_11285 [Bacteroidota bacterium]
MRTVSECARRHHSTVLFSLYLLLLHWAWASPAQAQCTGNDLADSQKYIVRSVTVETLFGRAPQALKDQLAKHRGELWSGDNRENYRREVKEFFQKNETSIDEDRSFGINQQNSLYVQSTFLNDCVQIVPVANCQSMPPDSAGNPVLKCVDVIIKIKVLPINTASLGANFLDLARSNKLRFYRELPRSLLAFNPAIWIEHDNAYGLGLAGSLSSDLLSLPTILGSKKTMTQNTRLQLSFSGSKSLTKSFYNTATSLVLSHTQALQLVESIGLEAHYVANQQPQGEWVLRTNALHIKPTALFKFNQTIFSQLSLGAGYRRAGNNVTQMPYLSSETIENAFESRAILDGSIAQGFIRAAAWYDAASLEKNAGSYRRLAAMVGYSKSFALPQWKCRIVNIDGQPTCIFPKKNPPAIGVELLLGAGYAWGEVPTYARFYGGNQQGNFLYNATSEPSLSQLPSGPLLRSFGRNRASAETTSNYAQGGTSYWNASLSVSLPIPILSIPLIPAETVEEGDSCFKCKSLKDILKIHVSKGKNLLIDALAIQKLTAQQRTDLTLGSSDSLTTEETARLASAKKAFQQARVDVQPETDKVWRKLTPTINYIADYANLFAIKPIVMFDVAGISTSSRATEPPSTSAESNTRTRMAVGGGLQLNVAVAKFEVGYLHTLRYQPGDDQGNFVVRLIFEKLF